MQSLGVGANIYYLFAHTLPSSWSRIQSFINIQCWVIRFFFAVRIRTIQHNGICFFFIVIGFFFIFEIERMSIEECERSHFSGENIEKCVFTSENCLFFYIWNVLNAEKQWIRFDVCRAPSNAPQFIYWNNHTYWKSIEFSRAGTWWFFFRLLKPAILSFHVM